MINQDHIFIDTETGGLDPKDSCIIELAAIRTDSRGKVLASYCDRIIPDREVQPQAAKINEYQKESWGGIPFSTAIESFNRSLVYGQKDKVVFVAHFADFDRGFIREDCQRHSCEVPLNTRAWICTGALIWPYLFNGQIKSRKLTDVCKFLDIPYEFSHTATSDAKACCDVYWELMRRYSTILLTHTAVSQSGGGKIFRGIEKLVNGF